MNQMLKLSENFKAENMKMFQWSIKHPLEKKVENISKEIEIKKKRTKWKLWKQKYYTETKISL